MHPYRVQGGAGVPGAYVRFAFPICKNRILLGGHIAGPLLWLRTSLSRTRCPFVARRFRCNLHRRTLFQLDVRRVEFQHMDSGRITHTDDRSLAYFHYGGYGGRGGWPDIQYGPNSQHGIGYCRYSLLPQKERRKSP